MRPVATSPGSHAAAPTPAAMQVIAVEGKPKSWITPIGDPLSGTARSVVPLPVTLTVRWLLWQADPLESTVRMPGTVDVPTVTCDPPLSASEVLRTARPRARRG